MNVIRILDHTGDTPVTYDPAKAAETESAKATVDRYLGAGWVLVATAPADVGGKRLTALDPTVSEAVLIPPRVGG